MNLVINYINDNPSGIRFGACSNDDQNEKGKIVMMGMWIIDNWWEIRWDFAMVVEAGSADDIKLRHAYAKLKNEPKTEWPDENSTTQSDIHWLYNVQIVEVKI